VERFRKIFVIEPTHDVGILKRYTDTIKFISNGSEKVEDLPDRIESSLQDFDPLKDAVVAMGRVSACMLTGFFLAKLFPKDIIMYGIYNNDNYLFLEANCEDIHTVQ
jgi:hypothetical protein